MEKTRNFQDKTIVERCKKGDKKAYVLLVERWHQRLCKQAFWYTKDKELAQDIAQESWNIIFNKLYTLKDTGSFSSWALSIVNRKSIDTLRKQKKTEKKLYNYYEDSKRSNETNENHKAVDYNDNHTPISDSEIVINEIKKLPKNQQVVLRLFYLEEYSLEEISNMLNISKGTVKSRLFYAREKLKSILKNKNYEK